MSELLYLSETPNALTFKSILKKVCIVYRYSIYRIELYVYHVGINMQRHSIEQKQKKVHVPSIY